MTSDQPRPGQPTPDQPSDDRPRTALSRRAVLGTSAALGVGLPLVGLGAAPADAAGRGDRAAHPASVAAAVRFLQLAVDAHHATGPRLAQSYQDASGLNDIGFVYDNALAVIALLVGGDVARARAVGDALVYAQTHDADFDDFRLRQGYHTDDFGAPKGPASFGGDFAGTAVGDMAWSGIALAQLARRTGVRSYLTGALRIGRWIQRHTYSTTGLGGYTFGETAGLVDHKSAEHNIDVYALFRLLARLSGDDVWTSRAQHAWDFVTAVWNADAGFFFTGSDDGSTVNQRADQRPEDVQSWSWLAARKRRYAGALDWARTNLATTDTPVRANSALTGLQVFSGVTFATGSLTTDTRARIGGQPWNPMPDDGAVWFEGTSQLALALCDRDDAGDRARSADLLTEVRRSQGELGRGQTFGGKPAPGGIVAASSPLDTGFGFGYFPNLHVGATSWYVFAATNRNPYRFL